jgi:hypothetical protein
MWRWLPVVLLGCGGGGQSPPDGPFGDPPQIDAGPAQFTAIALPGGLDRMVIIKSFGDTCIGITVVNPGQGGVLGLPPNWGLESASARQPAAACDPRFAGPVTDSFEATFVAGAATWQGSPFPAVIQNIDARLEFDGAPSWCPPSDDLRAADLPVE